MTMPSTRPEPTSDELAALLGRISDGDNRAFAQFYDLTADRVYGMALRVARDAGFSEEITQEVYLAVWRTARNYDRASGSALAWLLTMAHRRAVDRVRSESASTRRSVAYGLAEAGKHSDDVADIAVRRDTARMIRTGLESLTPLQRESVELAYFHGLTYREVAEKLDVSLPTIKSRIRDGLRRLRLSAPHAAA